MNRYSIIAQLGEQAQGFISQGENNETGEKVVIKQYKKKFYTWQDCMQQKEIKVLRIFNHQNIVKLKELIKENNTVFCVYEHMDQNLFDFYQSLRDTNGQFTETEIKSIMYQIFSGLNYTHKMNFFHRDLCLENVYINHDSQQVKISNFSASREMSLKTQLTDYITTRWYRAPEQLLHSPSYGYKVDCWAAGCIMAELFLLGPLFGGSSESDQLWRIIKILGTPSDWPEFYSLINNMTKKKGSIPQYESQDFSHIVPNASPEALDLLKKLLTFNPNKRYSSAQALKHPFFTGQSLQKHGINRQGSFQSGNGTPQNKQKQNSNNMIFMKEESPSSSSKISKFGKSAQSPQNSMSQQLGSIFGGKKDQVLTQEDIQKKNANNRMDSKGSQDIENIQEEREDELSQNSQKSQKSNPVPLDVQQQQMSLKRPGSRDCSRDQRANNEQIKQMKEMGSTLEEMGQKQKDSENNSSKQEDEEEYSGSIDFNPMFRNNNQVQVTVTTENPVESEINFKKGSRRGSSSFVPLPRKSEELSINQVQEIIKKQKQDGIDSSENLENNNNDKQDQNNNNLSNSNQSGREHVNSVETDPSIKIHGVKVNAAVNDREQFGHFQVEHQKHEREKKLKEELAKLQEEQGTVNQNNYDQIPPKTPDNPPGIDITKIK